MKIRLFLLSALLATGLLGQGVAIKKSADNDTGVLLQGFDAGTKTLDLADANLVFGDDQIPVAKVDGAASSSDLVGKANLTGGNAFTGNQSTDTLFSSGYDQTTGGFQSAGFTPNDWTPIWKIGGLPNYYGITYGQGSLFGYNGSDSIDFVWGDPDNPPVRLGLAGNGSYFSGPVNAASFTGSGTGLTGVAKLAGGNTFDGVQSFGYTTIETTTAGGTTNIRGNEITLDDGVSVNAVVTASSFNGKADDSTVVKLTGNQTVGGTKTFTSPIHISTDGETPVELSSGFGVLNISGNVEAIAGTITAASFVGAGGGVTDIDAGNITFGTLNAARLPSDAARRSGGNTFTGSQLFTGTVFVGVEGTTDTVSLLDGSGACILVKDNSGNIKALINESGLGNIYASGGAQFNELNIIGTTALDNGSIYTDGGGYMTANALTALGGTSYFSYLTVEEELIVDGTFTVNNGSTVLDGGNIYTDGLGSLTANQVNVATGNVNIHTNGSGILVRSDDGTPWLITVSNAGTVTVTSP